MTKWHDEKHKFEQGKDIPIGVSNESLGADAYDTRTYYCSHCKRPLIKLSNYAGDMSYNVSYYCDYGCPIETTDPVEELRSKSKLEMGEGPITEPAIGLLPDPNAPFYQKKKPVYQGGIKALANKGLKITSYSDNTRGKWKKKDNKND